MDKKTYIYAVVFIAFLVQLRLIPHPPNFTPILAAAIFSGFYFRHFFLGLFIIILSMFIGDLYLGLHNTMFFTYISLSIAVMFGLFINKFWSMDNFRYVRKEFCRPDEFLYVGNTILSKYFNINFFIFIFI